MAGVGRGGGRKAPSARRRDARAATKVAGCRLQGLQGWLRVLGACPCKFASGCLHACTWPAACSRPLIVCSGWPRRTATANRCPLTRASVKQPASPAARRRTPFAAAARMLQHAELDGPRSSRPAAAMCDAHRPDRVLRAPCSVRSPCCVNTPIRLAHRSSVLIATPSTTWPWSVQPVQLPLQAHPLPAHHCQSPGYPLFLAPPKPVHSHAAALLQMKSSPLVTPLHAST